MPIPMNMVNTNTVLNGNFRSLDRLKEFIDHPISLKGTAELKMTKRTRTAVGPGLFRRMDKKLAS